MDLEEKIKDAIEKDSICKWLKQLDLIDTKLTYLLLHLLEIRKTEISDDLHKS